MTAADGRAHGTDGDDVPTCPCRREPSGEWILCARHVAEVARPHLDQLTADACCEHHTGWHAGHGCLCCDCTQPGPYVPGPEVDRPDVDLWAATATPGRYLIALSPGETLPCTHPTFIGPTIAEITVYRDQHWVIRQASNVIDRGTLRNQPKETHP